MMEEIQRYQQDERKEMMPFASPPSIVRFSVSNHLATHTLDWLEHDLLHFFPGTRRVAVYQDHCDWEGAFCGEIWTQGRIWFLDRYREHVKVSINPPDPRLDMDIYNVGLSIRPTLPLYLPLKDFEVERYQVGKIFHGPFHGLGFWWRVITHDPLDRSVLCVPAPPPISHPDGVPRFLYRCPSPVHYKAGQIEYWCPCCWKSSYSMKEVTKVSLADLTESQVCTICGRDFCADDAYPPEWAAYPYRHNWRRLHQEK